MPGGCAVDLTLGGRRIRQKRADKTRRSVLVSWAAARGRGVKTAQDAAPRQLVGPVRAQRVHAPVEAGGERRQAAERARRDAHVDGGDEAHGPERVEVQRDIHVVVQVGVVAVHVGADAAPRIRSDGAVRAEQGWASERQADEREIGAEVGEGADEAQGSRAVVERSRARDGGRPGLAQHGLFDAFEPALAGHAVGVEAREDAARRGVETGRGCCGNAAAGLVHHARAELPGHVGAVVGGSVVHDHDLVGLPRLAPQSGEAAAKVVGVIEHRDDDGHGGSRGYICHRPRTVEDAPRRVLPLDRSPPGPYGGCGRCRRTASRTRSHRHPAPVGGGR
jgi:hypothetical protein